MKKIISILLCLAMMFALVACGEDVQTTSGSNSGSESNSGIKTDKPEFVEIAASDSRTDDDVGFQFEAPEKGEEIAVFETNYGDIKIRLFPDSAPIAVANFKGLIGQGYYDGVIFHRVIKDFMIQGGDPKGTGMGGESLWGEGFEYEFNANLLHFNGALSMAHSSLPNSNGSQFFIVNSPSVSAAEVSMYGLDQYYSDEALALYEEHGGAYYLDGMINSDGHAVFGQVFEGMDVVDEISSVETDSNDKPLKDVVIEKAYLTRY